MIDLYTPADPLDQNDIYGQDWSRDMLLRKDSIAVALSAIPSRVDGQPMGQNDCAVAGFQVVVGSSGTKTAFIVTNPGQNGITYNVKLKILTTNNVTLNRSVPLPTKNL